MLNNKEHKSVCRTVILVTHMLVEGVAYWGKRETHTSRCSGGIMASMAGSSVLTMTVTYNKPNYRVFT